MIIVCKGLGGVFVLEKNKLCFVWCWLRFSEEWFEKKEGVMVILSSGVKLYL